MSLFTEVIAKIPKLNGFPLSFEILLTMEFGQIVPVLCKEVLPRDKFWVQTEVVVKTAPMLAPIFSRIDLYLHYFFVPNRLLQSDWEDFITTGVDGLSDNLTPPTMTLGQLATFGGATAINDGSLQDYMNIPKVSMGDLVLHGIDSKPVNVLNFLAYQKVYSDWFRDELLDSYEFEPIAGGPIATADLSKYLTMRYRSWKKDYFTSARPNAQLGSPINVPISGSLVNDGPLRFKLGVHWPVNNENVVSLGGSNEEEIVDFDGTTRYLNGVRLSTTANSGFSYGDGISLDEAGIDVNNLRRALKVQQWQERNMRGGNRYIENIFHHFGVKSSDARLQRAELIGGRKIPIVVSEITQTSAFQTYNEVEEGQEVLKDSTYLGQLAGKGGSVGNSGRIKWNAEEHGWIICVASIMPKAAYMQGLPRQYWRMSYLDYAWPLFGNLGEQEVYNGEIYLAQDNPESAFGYQSRYAEYKFNPNEIHGAFRSSMAYWHNGRIFDSAPNLNNDFVQLNGGQDDSTNQGQNRIFPTLQDGYGHFYLHMFHNISGLRALPKYGIPSI